MTTTVAPRPPFGLEITAEQFERVRTLLEATAGIQLSWNKQALVRARLARRLRLRSLSSISEYLRAVEEDTTGKELADLVDALTTNKTSFFREPDHFAFLEKQLPVMAKRKSPVRIWSAGCATGEEPYSLALLAQKLFGTEAERRVRILATDVSARALQIAKAGHYRTQSLRDVPAEYVHAFPSVDEGRCAVQDSTRRLVQFARLNLMAEWPIARTFDVILCRNVMIYFARDTRERLLQRFKEWLTPGGYLLVGHAESLSGMSHTLRYVQPATYQVCL